MTEGVRYIKVAKIDKDGVDNTNTLQSITKLIIPYSTGAVTYDILNITEAPNFFTYYVENPNIEWADRADIKYNFTGTLDTSIPHIKSKATNPINIVSGYGDIYGFYSSNNKSYTFNTYAQKDLHFKISGSVFIYNPPVSLALVKAPNGVLTSPTRIILTTQSFPFAGGPQNLNIEYNLSSSSPGDRYYLSVDTGGSASFDPALTSSPAPSFIITSSIPSGPSIETIPEPYFTSNFARSLDCQPTLNNAITNRRGTLYQDVDYNSGILSPTNYTLILNNSAIKAEVPDSNYTLTRHTRPRYEGTKNTSQKLNEWTPDGDWGSNEGTYGKYPSIDLTKTVVAYCDFIGGYAPEKMNTYAAHVLYLIKSDGSVLAPNISPTSLPDVQNVFITGENLEINTLAGSAGQTVIGTHRIDRGGARIQPILYNQIGHSPALFSSSINLTDDNQEGGVVSDFQGIIRKSADGVMTNGTWDTLDLDVAISSSTDSGFIPGVGSNYKFGVTQAMIDEGVSIDLKADIGVRSQITTINQWQYATSAYIRFYKSSGGGSPVTLGYPFDGKENFTGYEKLSIGFTLTPQNMNVGDEYIIQQYRQGNLAYVTPTYDVGGKLLGTQTFNSEYKAVQNPIPNNTIPTGSLWISSSDNPGLGNNVLYTTSSALISYFDNPSVYQSTISNSGFFETIPWSLKIGDEFRFEGREDRVWGVDNFQITSSASIPILAVNLNAPLYSSSIVNYDNFLIRRYTDDASSIIFQSDKPASSLNPFLIKPQYLNKEFDDNLGNIIEDLTDKGIIT